MNKAYTPILWVLPLMLISACAHPVVVPPVSVNDSDMSCPEILVGIEEAERYRREARTEDTFKWSYMLIAPAVVSVYNMDKAERAALDRKEQLNQLAKRKHCGEDK